MVSIKEAYEIVKKNLPGMKVIGGLETDDRYYFNTVPNNAKGKIGFINSIANMVYKSNGKFIRSGISTPLVMNDLKSTSLKEKILLKDILSR